jgi:molecular chaperone Hsp33
MNSSYIQKFIFEKLPLKGSLVMLDDCWQTIVAQREYPSGLKRILGELLAANVLLTSNLKVEGKVICQIQDHPHFNLVVSECSNQFIVRATARFLQVDGALSNYANLFAKGRLVVSIDSCNDGNLYQSVIAFNGNSVADILNNYMAQSEQLKSLFILAYTEERVAGFLLQQLPDTHNNFNLDLSRIFMLAQTLSAGELLNEDLEQIIYKVFNQDNVLLQPRCGVNFACSCDRNRVSEILRSLGREELQSLIAEQGDITVDCDYCNALYKFTADELQQLLIQISLQEITEFSKQIN